MVVSSKCVKELVVVVIGFVAEFMVVPVVEEIEMFVVLKVLIDVVKVVFFVIAVKEIGLRSTDS